MSDRGTNLVCISFYLWPVIKKNIINQFQSNFDIHLDQPEVWHNASVALAILLFKMNKILKLSILKCLFKL